MADLTRNRRRLVLWSAPLAVLVPLAVLLGFQYSWLTKLERASTVARLASLANYADAVAQEVEYAYVRRAERALNLPSYLVHHDCLEDVAGFFRRKKVDGVKRFFIVTYLDEFAGTLYLLDPDDGRMSLAGEDDAAAAVYLATEPWRGPGAASRPSLGGFYVSGLDPSNPVIFNPVENGESELVGLAGMIVDRGYFEREVLPAAIRKSLPELSGSDRVAATVKDAQGRLVYPSGPLPFSEPDVERELGFAFSGWSVGLGGLRSPDEWARAQFLTNMTLSLLLAAGLLAGVAAVLRAAAREMKLSEMKSDFVSNVSHELRTPLSSIRVFGELLSLGKAREEERVREFGEYIHNESRRLTQLVDNILDFSKIESGRRTYRFAPASVEEAVTAAVKAYEAALEPRGVRIAYEPPTGRLPELEIDADALVQAVSNLLDNAVKYAGDRPPEVAVRVVAGPRKVVVEVEDHGIGIEPGEKERIFERFHRVGTGLVHDVKGSGLGLAIVRHVAEAHGGRVTVESALGHGSTFAIHLPVLTPRPLYEGGLTARRSCPA